MKPTTNKNIKIFLKKNKSSIILFLFIILIGIRMITGPKTIASGNGYSHQIGSFGTCDMNFDGCTNKATHRRHHFFGNEDYCDSCWYDYGQNMFDGLSNQKSDSGIFEYDEYKCRHTRCDNKAKYSDWDRRFCSEHLQGTKYCRYPNCSERIPINSLDNYCSNH